MGWSKFCVVNCQGGQNGSCILCRPKSWILCRPKSIRTCRPCCCACRRLYNIGSHPTPRSSVSPTLSAWLPIAWQCPIVIPNGICHICSDLNVIKISICELLLSISIHLWFVFLVTESFTRYHSHSGQQTIVKQARGRLNKLNKAHCLSFCLCDEVGRSSE